MMGMNCYGPIRVRQSDCELMVGPNIKKLAPYGRCPVMCERAGLYIIAPCSHALCTLYKRLELLARVEVRHYTAFADS